MIEVTEVHENGKLGLSLGFPNEDSLQLNMSGKVYVEGSHDPSLFYVADGLLVARPESPIVLTGMQLSNVPSNSVLLINGMDYSAEGTVELDFPLPGTYNLSVSSFPYLDWVGVITV